MKAKKSKPSAVLHMVRWGFLSGIILAISFMIFIVGLLQLQDPPPAIIWQEVLVSISYYAFFLGGIPGIVLGFIEGWILGVVLSDIPHPFTKSAMKKYRGPVYSYIFIIPFLLTLFLALLSSLGNLFLGLGFVVFFGIPTIIAAFASVYAAHRYMFRLRLWSGDFDNAKIKAKHEHINSNRLALRDIDEAYVIPDIANSEEHGKRLS